ncbi:MAG: YdeI/OmpD-associated family protein [Cytophagales bacterium]|nr:YdeI/OmpD-associated family protein [Cytophagales bacterium]
MDKKIETFCPSDKKDWRDWLEQNHKKKEAVWLIFFKKKSSTPNLSWSEAVDVALCFGWIDSVKKTIDSERYIQYFSRRKPNSIWSKINKDKIEKLTESGLMTEPGLKSIEIAKQNGSWTLLDSVENLEIPEDLEQEFKQYPESKDNFLCLSKSVRKTMLAWVALAKRQDTRAKRVTEIAKNARHKKKPKQFRLEKNGIKK